MLMTNRFTKNKQQSSNMEHESTFIFLILNCCNCIYVPFAGKWVCSRCTGDGASDTSAEDDFDETFEDSHVFGEV